MPEYELLANFNLRLWNVTPVAATHEVTPENLDDATSLLDSADEGAAEPSHSRIPYICAKFAAHFAGSGIKNWSEYVAPGAAPNEVTSQIE